MGIASTNKHLDAVEYWEFRIRESLEGMSVEQAILEELNSGGYSLYIDLENEEPGANPWLAFEIIFKEYKRQGFKVDFIRGFYPGSFYITISWK